MKKSIITILLVTFTHLVQAEDGHRLWLRQKTRPYGTSRGARRFTNHQYCQG